MRSPRACAPGRFKTGFSSQRRPGKPCCALAFGLLGTERHASKSLEFRCAKQRHYQISSTVAMQQPSPLAFHRFEGGTAETSAPAPAPTNLSTNSEQLFTAPMCLPKARITQVSSKFASFGPANAGCSAWPAFVTQGCHRTTEW